MYTQRAKLEINHILLPTPQEIVLLILLLTGNISLKQLARTLLKLVHNSHKFYLFALKVTTALVITGLMA